jgi:hypothetical protein
MAPYHVGFHEEQLITIKKATAGFFKKSSRKNIARYLLSFKLRIDAAKKLGDTERHAALKDLLYEATAARHQALLSGANSFGHPQWAAAAACESWLLELLLGNPKSIARVEDLINELSMRN